MMLSRSKYSFCIMKSILFLLLITLISASQARVPSHRHTRRQRGTCTEVGVDRRKSQDTAQHFDLDPEYPLWVDDLRSDPDVLCGNLTTNGNSSAFFKLAGFYHETTGYYLPALWEFYYYAEPPQANQALYSGRHDYTYGEGRGKSTDNGSESTDHRHLILRQ